MHFLLGLSVLMIATACSRQYKVDGKTSITSLDGKKLYLMTFQDEQWTPVDSAEIIHGLFTMKGQADSVRMVTLFMNGECIMPVVLEDGHITIDLSPSQLEAKGTPLNDRLYEFIARRNAMEVQLEELERKEMRQVLDGADIDEVHARLEQEGQQLQQEKETYVRQFITDNYENVLGPGIFMLMCSAMPYPLMTKQIEDIMRTAPATFKADPFVKDFLQKAKENMRLMEEHRRLMQNTPVTAQR